MESVVLKNWVPCQSGNKSDEHGYYYTFSHILIWVVGGDFYSEGPCILTESTEAIEINDSGGWIEISRFNIIIIKDAWPHFLALGAADSFRQAHDVAEIYLKSHKYLLINW